MENKIIESLISSSDAEEEETGIDLLLNKYSLRREKRVYERYVIFPLHELSYSLLLLLCFV